MLPTRILTCPERLKKPLPYVATGNEKVSLPSLLLSQGAIVGLSVLHERGGGLLEIEGAEEAPLFAPFVQKRDGRVIEFVLAELIWERSWIPHFFFSSPFAHVEVTIFAPPGKNGFVYRMKVQAKRALPSLKIGLTGNYHAAYVTHFRRTLLAGERRLSFDAWTRTLCLEAVPGFPELVVACLAELESQEPVFYEGGIGRPELLETEACFSLASSDLTPFSFRLWGAPVLEKGEAVAFTCYVALARERDGASTRAIALRREGWGALYEETLSFLEKKAPPLVPDMPPLQEKASRNFFYNYFFAWGRALDSEKLFAVTSRSPHYYVSAAFWERDTFLWSFPALLLADPELAREALLRLFELHGKEAGEHAHYMGGQVLYPGFELDEICSYAIALGYYLKATRDRALLKESTVIKTLRFLVEKLKKYQHEKIPLFRTFLLPSDDPAYYPYVTYNNVLAWKFLSLAGDFLQEEGLKKKAVAVEKSIWKHCVVEKKGRRQFAFATDLESHYQFYDDPPGSLLLLPFYGFCREDDPVYEATVSWIFSQDNPYFIEGKFSGTGCEHYPDSLSVMTLCAELLTKKRRKRALEALCRMPLDQGIACESVDPETGSVATGAAMASLAGFLSFSLFYPSLFLKMSREGGKE